MSVQYKTIFASIDNYNKGGVQVLMEDPKRYVFSNMFEIAATNAPYERIVAAKNLDYSIEIARAEGNSPWYVCAHDEFVVAMDYEVEVHYVKLADESIVDEDKDGAVMLNDNPDGKKMGRIILQRGHQALLPEKTAYRFYSSKPATLLLQSIIGEVSVEKWADICLK
ncbi:hydroxyquinol 1,2-dioxygenase [Vibrio cincinnatiensis]|uniref:Hydroxyquinol 1,2-dioxygenase n=3 Tax=Vibrio cincinnatiensis TaxID=675 RepID=A0A1T4KL22_VIBCI|nr:hydroxyquinol 1,2-dioxygenase [Vibrio cincinnatiensis]MCG3721429.1 hydroxyquinol 1,2-dioxygenase [Vibrio cincinnatiensis]MCG3726042.1 hydroxyquinol 1,2-dioxygenase [Vibrio cincinnatiensis]MCG3736397.1 hydroxyquinol 1,2-dioxygenase [Vibrio cincinnatiensis]MCG3742793.1 hydroxyquinol 1,2-dioxygenase [Vibrio cincinnatiensis]MCG3747272.1 hydroxyquinol 1,2-dioxygenase [Vibrio cincinnatiensis]